MNKDSISLNNNLSKALTLNPNNTYLLGSALISLALIVGFLIRLFSLIKYTTFDIGPAPDQVRDAFVYMDMWQGKMPILGPSASVGGYHLPPLYYYLVFPFTLFGAAPVWQALPNALFSFLAIPALILLIYELLEDVKQSRRLFLSGLAGLWYAVIFGEIFIGTFQWNPSPIPFFLITCALIFKYQIESKFSNLIPNIILWLLYGFFMAILVSLHSTALFVMPVVFIVSLVFYIYKQRRQLNKCWLSGLSILAVIVALIPYWKGELARNFLNSKQIISVVLGSGNEGSSTNIIKKLSKIVFNYFELGQQLYFPNRGLLYLVISVVFLSLILYFATARFKGNINIKLFLIFTWLIYLYAAANFEGTFFIHYKLLFIFAPIILAMLAIAYLDYSKQINLIASRIIMAGILVSICINLGWDYQYLASKYSSQRLVATSDIISIFQELPQESTICEPRHKGNRTKVNPYNYIDRYITKKNFNFVTDCSSGDYLLQAKYKLVQSIDNMWPLFTIEPNKIERENLRLVSESYAARVYQQQ